MINIKIHAFFNCLKNYVEKHKLTKFSLNIFKKEQLFFELLILRFSKF